MSKMKATDLAKTNVEKVEKKVDRFYSGMLEFRRHCHIYTGGCLAGGAM